MTTHRISNWTAKRVGAAMTINGKGPSGEPVKVTNVATIEGDLADGPVAVLANGDRVQLA